MDLFELRFQSPITQIMTANNYGIAVSDRQLGSAAMQTLLASASKFDLIITQAMMSESVSAALAYRFKAPSVALSNLQPNLWCDYLVRKSIPFSFLVIFFLGGKLGAYFIHSTSVYGLSH